MKHTNPTYVALGSNVGDRQKHLKEAKLQLQRLGAEITRQSSVRETQPFGVRDQPRFLNQVLELKWDSTPAELLRVAKRVEQLVGRTPSRRWGPREIDVDILLMGDLVLHGEDLHIPHPGLPQRSFVLQPLVELQPDLVHPETRVKVSQMLARIERN